MGAQTLFLSKILMEQFLVILNQANLSLALKFYCYQNLSLPIGQSIINTLFLLAKRNNERGKRMYKGGRGGHCYDILHSYWHLPERGRQLGEFILSKITIERRGEVSHEGAGKFPHFSEKNVRRFFQTLSREIFILNDGKQCFGMRNKS